MNTSKLLAVAVFISGLIAGGVLAQQRIGKEQGGRGERSGPMKESPEPGEPGFAKLYVRIELRGTLTDTGSGATVTALRHAYKVSDPSEELPTLSMRQRWTLDFSRAKELGQAATKLDGKSVLVTGWGELRELFNAPEPPGAGSSFGRTTFRPASPYWVIGDSIGVTELRLTESK